MRHRLVSMNFVVSTAAIPGTKMFLPSWHVLFGFFLSSSLIVATSEAKEPTAKMVKATWQGVVIAESDKCEEVEGNKYFPPNSVKMEYMKPNSNTSTCAWKGVANYYDVVVNGHTNPGAAWYYADPKPKAMNIKGYVAFWKGVQVA